MKILLVEDDSDDAEFLRVSLAQHGSVYVTRTSLISDAVTALDNGEFDVVLLDLNLPDGRGAECVEKIQEASALVPIVVLSGQGDEDYAVEILNRGVQDYLVKWEGDGRTILRAIRYAVERKRAEVRLNYLARHDALTGIPNRQYLRDQLSHATTRALRGHRTMALLLLDLDRFKIVNETLGHEAGDMLLRAVVQRLTGSVREGDLIARLGGDEFAVLLEDVEGPLEVEAVASSIGAAFQEPFDVGGRQVSVTASVGITVCPVDSTDPVALLNNADIAMYQAKEQGRQHRSSSSRRACTRRSCPITGSRPTSRTRSRAGSSSCCTSRSSVSPIIASTPSRHCCIGTTPSADAWARASSSRWPKKPATVIPLGLWVFEEVCRQLKRWESAGVPVPRVAINVAAGSLPPARFS